MKLSEYSGMVLLESNTQPIHMDEQQQKYVLAWFRDNKPEMVKEIMGGGTK